MLHAIRPLDLDDLPKLREHLTALSPESKYKRFGYPISSNGIDSFCSLIESNWKQHVLFCAESDNKQLIAVGHIALVDEPELAFSVLDQYQGQGIGNQLVQHCIEWCRKNRVLKGCMVCLSTNAAIRHLCKKNGMKMTSHSGEVIANFELDPVS